MQQINIDFIKSVVFVVIYSLGLIFLIVGGSTFQHRKFIGRMNRKLIKIMDFPIIRMLPKVAFSINLFFGFLTYKNIYQIYLVNEFPNIVYVFYVFAVLAAVTAILFLYMALDNPKSIESKDPSLLCEHDQKYYEGYDHFSHFFRMVIMKSNRTDFVVFLVLALATSVVFLGPSLRYLYLALEYGPNNKDWSKNKMINSIAVIARIYYADPRIGLQCVVFLTLTVYTISCLLDQVFLFLSGKSRYEFLKKLEDSANKKKDKKKEKKSKKGNKKHNQ